MEKISNIIVFNGKLIFVTSKGRIGELERLKDIGDFKAKSICDPLSSIIINEFEKEIKKMPFEQFQKSE
jgi:hypothetical protein